MNARKGLSGLVMGLLPVLAMAQAVTGPVMLGGPEFDVYNPPAPFTNYTAAEPTMDINRVTGAAHMIYDNQILKTTWDDTAGISPAPATWVDNSDPVIQAQPNLDPFLVGVEHKNADGSFNPRIWGVSFKLATSQISYSDDDGETWIPSFVQGQPAGVDNESMAAGPYPIDFPITKPVFEQALYYCAHAVVNAFCLRSDDGGLTYGPGVPIFPGTGCSNHGHVKVGNDGTVYVPINNSCQGAEGIAVSTTAGLLWSYVPVPETRNGRWDPGLAIANDGKTVYFGYGEQNDDRPMIIKGVLNKSDPTAPTIDWDPAGAVDVGAPAGLNNIAFSTVVAGDPDRAAYIFHGSTEIGDSGQDLTFGQAVWHLYAAFTYDGGATWTLRDITPDDPSQKGAICDGGIGCPANPPNRNLLDFMDAVLDAQGRVVIGFADGCVGSCVAENGPASYTRIGGLARQATGLSLFSEFDDQFKAAALKAPVIYAQQKPASVELNWHVPKGQVTSGYRVYRAASADALNESSAPYATVSTASFEDSNAPAGSTYYYRVRSIKGDIASGYSNEVASTSTEAFCPYSSRSACYGPVRLARLDAAPLSGGAPLTVRFDARPSQQGLSDAIVAYHFDFGDGSEPVTDTDGLIEHVYTDVGAYRAGVSYTTASTAKSGNTADLMIMVGPEYAVSGLLGEKSGRGLLLGAPNLLMLAILFVLSLTRRKVRS